MSRRTPTTQVHIYGYALLLALGLVAWQGLTQAVTADASNSLMNQKPKLAVARDLGASYVNQASPRLNELDQVLQQRSTNKISTRVLTQTADGDNTPIVILLSDQADLSAAYSMKDHDARGWYVYNTLTEHAARTQAGLKAFLDLKSVAYQSFWAANMLVATADRELIESLAARPDVARVDSNLPTRWIEDPSLQKSASAPESTTAVEWGVTNVKAPALWALGFTGTGMVVGGLDTGIRWTHNVLRSKYRGWNGVTADHNYNWRDAVHSGGGVCGPNTMAPCDDNGHGTHTVGTMVGDDGINQVGVAPGAKWMGCRNMNQGDGTPATYTECFQFTIAPTDLAGSNPDPTRRPHVLNNSWSCPASEGCTTGAELETIVNSTQAAGIFVVVSAGNSGPNCFTVANPPAIYSNSFSVGAIDINNNLAGFSSRGPSAFYTPNVLKPNISAPGVAVRSATRSSDIAFSTLQGTSMAGPHVAGVVALLWSARPQLVRNIAATKSLLQNTANPLVTLTPAQACGGTSSTQIPNNSFGYGRVDALAAYNASAPTASTATISGTVTAPDGSPLSGVVMQLLGPTNAKTITDSNGVYRFENVDTQNLYILEPARVNYSFSPEKLSFTLTENKTDAFFTSRSQTPPLASPIDTAEYFVRQHYLDFLGREPDNSGFNFWSDQMLSCGNDAGCHGRRRINVSAAYFLSIEFQQTGGLVDGLYRASFTRTPTFAEFMPEAATVGQNVVVGRAGWEQQLATNKAAFVDAWVQRPGFRQVYPDALSNASYVDQLITNTGVSFSSNERDAWVNGLNLRISNRARVLQQIVEDARFASRKRNEMFVMMQYFGYLRRDPDPDGYNHWLQKLNSFGGNFEQAEMVKAFLSSIEYRARFPF